MKKIRIYILALCALCCVACAQDKELGKIESLLPDYTLPQGKSPADDRIVELYNQYGTYTLYEYERLDFLYGLTASYVYTLPDPLYAGDMLDLLEKIWFQFYPREFHRKYMPYKILLADSLLLTQSSGSLKLKYLYYGQNSIAIGYCSDTLRKMSASTKLEFKKELQRQLWNSWAYSSMEFPDEFFDVSDYSKTANKDKTSPDYARARGFVANNGSEWCTSAYAADLYQYLNNDLAAFMTSMTMRTSEEWAADLEYPLVKKKYDMLQAYFLEKYGVDLKRIGDTVYE